MTTLLPLILLSFLMVAAPQPPPMRPSVSPINCLTHVARCIPYFSSEYPDNAAGLPSSQCCQDVSSTMALGKAICLCYLMQHPRLLGVLLNTCIIMSVSTLYGVKDTGNEIESSLDSFYSGLAAQPKHNASLASSFDSMKYTKAAPAQYLVNIHIIKLGSV